MIERADGAFVGRSILRREDQRLLVGKGSYIGDLALPGICMPYCDLNDAADPCAGTGTCVRCSASDRWGLCMTDCSGKECNVDAFC